ncbi:PRC-barrel domain-containing protein, partial [Streptomyces zhihengii]
MQTDIDPRSLIGRKAFDRSGHKIGTVDEVYLDDATGVPEWAAVRTGLFSRDAFVPLEPSEIVDNALHVPYERGLIKDAPDFGVGRHLSPEQDGRDDDRGDDRDDARDDRDNARDDRDDRDRAA